MLHYLRIAVTALSLTACVLLVALWVRSYWWCDIISRIDTNSQLTTLGSNRGTVYFVRMQRLGFAGVVGVRMGPPAQHGWRHAVAAAPNFVSFRTGPRKNGWVVWSPHWFLCAMTATFAIAPWMHKIAWRFSLRTLLIATTLVAVTLGVVIYLAR